MDPAAALAFERAFAAARRAGLNPHISSGWRSKRAHEVLFDRAVAKYGSPAKAMRWVLPPDKSAHVRGMPLMSRRGRRPLGWSATARGTDCAAATTTNGGTSSTSGRPPARRGCPRRPDDKRWGLCIDQGRDHPPFEPRPQPSLRGPGLAGPSAPVAAARAGSRGQLRPSLLARATPDRAPTRCTYPKRSDDLRGGVRSAGRTPRSHRRDVPAAVPGTRPSAASGALSVSGNHPRVVVRIRLRRPSRRRRRGVDRLASLLRRVLGHIGFSGGNDLTVAGLEMEPVLPGPVRIDLELPLPSSELRKRRSRHDRGWLSPVGAPLTYGRRRR